MRLAAECATSRSSSGCVCLETPSDRGALPRGVGHDDPRGSLRLVGFPHARPTGGHSSLTRRGTLTSAPLRSDCVVERSRSPRSRAVGRRAPGAGAHASTALWQVAVSGNFHSPSGGGGFWVWAEFDSGSTGDVAVTDCAHQVSPTAPFGGAQPSIFRSRAGKSLPAWLDLRPSS